LPTSSPTSAPTTKAPSGPVVSFGDCDALDVVFLVDEGDSINGAEFTAMITFVKQIVDKLFASGIKDVHYAMTLFNDAVRTEVILGDDPISINEADFKGFVDTIVQAPSGLTCTAGGMQAAFRANFGPLKADGTVDPTDSQVAPRCVNCVLRDY
jgi:hypothetical protein